MNDELVIASPKWVCPEGHVSEGYPEAFSVRALSANVSTGNICPVCYVLWIAKYVPKVEEVR